MRVDSLFTIRQCNLVQLFKLFTILSEFRSSHLGEYEEAFFWYAKLCNLKENIVS